MRQPCPMPPPRFFLFGRRCWETQGMLFMDLNNGARTSVLQKGNSEAERLNRGCFCITLDRHALMEALNRDVGSQDFAQELGESHPSLFSNVPAFVPAETLIEMARAVDSVETAAR